jgi:hypothetical protein
MKISAFFIATLLSIMATPAFSQLMTPVHNSTRNHFVSLHSRDLAAWTRSPGVKPGGVVLTSAPMTIPVRWNQLVVSWNAMLPANAYLTVEARGVYPKNGEALPRATKYFVLGHWSVDPTRHVRQSVNKQADTDGDVQTDTLVLKQSGAQVQIRLRLGDDSGLEGAGETLIPLVRFLSLAASDTKRKTAPRQSNRLAWGKTIAVPERFQGDFLDQGGAVWCSPTSVSMILAYWSDRLKRPELTLTVPDVAHAVHDPQWPGTGNWAFNTAFAGSFPGIRAYTTRLDDLTDVESWIAAGVPVALSVDYGLLKGEKRSSGHLVVCNGFTANGDVVIADPGRRPLSGPYRVFPRKDVIAGWGASNNTVYLIYPESLTPALSPANRANS